MILTIRTDKPDAEVALFDAGGKKQFDYTWHADRQLAKELLGVLRDQLANVGADFTTLTGVVVFKGPGSFTGLRIGITVANTLAYGLDIPIVATDGDSWRADGLKRLAENQNDRLALPHYGAEANITMPKK